MKRLRVCMQRKKRSKSKGMNSKVVWREPQVSYPEVLWLEPQLRGKLPTPGMARAMRDSAEEWAGNSQPKGPEWSGEMDYVEMDYVH